MKGDVTALLSLWVYVLFVDKQLKTSLLLAHWERGREALLKKFLQKLQFCTPAFCLPAPPSRAPTSHPAPKWTKLQSTTQVKMRGENHRAQKTKWQPFQSTLQFHSIASMKKINWHLVTMLPSKGSVVMRTANSRSQFPPPPRPPVFLLLLHLHCGIHWIRQMFSSAH